MRVIVKVLGFFIIIWCLGFLLFIDAIPKEKKEGDYAEAAVVLTGGSKRIEEGVYLLNEQYVGKLFITGVNNKQTLPVLKEIYDFDVADIGTNATSTRGNAIEAREWIEQNNVTTILLVTANYHMPRSMLEFRSRISGVKITPHPVFPEKFYVDRWWFDKHTAFLVVSEYNKFMYALALIMLHQQ